MNFDFKENYMEMIAYMCEYISLDRFSDNRLDLCECKEQIGGDLFISFNQQGERAIIFNSFFEKGVTNVALAT